MTPPVNSRTAAVVAAHRMYETLGLCLEGLLGVIDEPCDLVFVDNGSGGALTAWAKARFPGITVLTLSRNLLFCGGFNAGLRHAVEHRYDFALIVNADSEVANPTFVSHLVEAMARRPRAAFIGPKVYAGIPGISQRTCLQFPNLLRNLWVWFPFRLVPKLVSRQPDVEHEVEFLNGVCVLCRVAALREIGLMDETFGAYVEDADWSWRGRAKGWTSVFTPVPSIIHHVESHGYEHHSFKVFLLKRNTVYWFLKVDKPMSARAYALAASLLAFLRLFTARPGAERTARKRFFDELWREYRRLLKAQSGSARAGALKVPLPEQALKRIQTTDVVPDPDV